MGWFAAQIKERMLRDEEEFSDAMEEISSIITGTRSEPAAVHREEEQKEHIISILNQKEQGGQ